MTTETKDAIKTFEELDKRQRRLEEDRDRLRAEIWKREQAGERSLRQSRSHIQGVPGDFKRQTTAEGPLRSIDGFIDRLEAVGAELTAMEVPLREARHAAGRATYEGAVSDRIYREVVLKAALALTVTWEPMFGLYLSQRELRAAALMNHAPASLPLALREQLAAFYEFLRDAVKDGVLDLSDLPPACRQAVTSFGPGDFNGSALRFA